MVISPKKVFAAIQRCVVQPYTNRIPCYTNTFSVAVRSIYRRHQCCLRMSCFNPKLCGKKHSKSVKIIGMALTWVFQNYHFWGSRQPSPLLPRRQDFPPFDNVFFCFDYKFCRKYFTFCMNCTRLMHLKELKWYNFLILYG